MASLLERIQGAAPTTGPIRSNKNKSSSRSHTPYTRPVKGDADQKWGHDLFEANNTLGARLGVAPQPPRTKFTTQFRSAVEKATGGSVDVFNIRGASSNSNNVVEISGLLKGTTAADVTTIFKRCGEVISAKPIPGPEVKIRVTFKDAQGAQQAVKTFDGQQADGKTLSVKLIGISSAPTLAGRLMGEDGLSVVRQEGSVDILIANGADGASKMRSDAMVNDPRSQVLVAPPGADPKDYTQSRGGRGRGRGRGGRRGGRGRGGRGGMDTD